MRVKIRLLEQLSD